MNQIEKFKLKLRFQGARFRANFFPSFYLSHSQFGEDMIVRALTADQKQGFFIDIGAHHPVYYSNTYHFYSKGWRGINIDAIPGSMEAFRLLRPGDRNLEICLGAQDGVEVDFFLFDQGAFNTFDRATADRVISEKHAKLMRTVRLKTQSLQTVLRQNLPTGQKVDLLSIDIEGLDEAILRSNVWSEFSPRVLIFENHAVSLAETSKNPLVQFLMSHGYRVAGATGPSIIMKLER